VFAAATPKRREYSLNIEINLACTAPATLRHGTCGFNRGYTVELCRSGETIRDLRVEARCKPEGMVQVIEGGGQVETSAK
jgi:hypothetical protein